MQCNVSITESKLNAKTPLHAALVSATSAATASARSPDSGDVITPAFDVALVGRAGDAVIAGTAAPGAAVELLRNGEPLIERLQIKSDTSS